MIPARAHFIWFGPQLPWVHTLAIRSAALRGGFERIVLHHSHDLSRTPIWPELIELPGFESRIIDARAILGTVGERADELSAIYNKLEAPAARSNVLRAAILAAEGGVYLDLDTITLGRLDRLCAAHGAFCGLERVIWASWVRRNQNLVTRTANLIRAGVRELCRQLPDGWRHFRNIERMYPAAANNAVLAAEPAHPFILRLLANMVGLPATRHRVRYALGTHLLQDTLAEGLEHDLRVFPPRYFYPLGPEISHHWFRLRRSLPPLDEVLSADTLVVHWYASVRTTRLVPRINPAYVHAHANRQLFSALVLPLLRS